MEENELDKLIQIAYTSNHLTKRLAALNKIEAQFKGYIALVKPIEDSRKINRDKLYEIATELKEKGSEHWAVGEMLERTMILFGALDYGNVEYIGNRKQPEQQYD